MKNLYFLTILLFIAPLHFLHSEEVRRDTLFERINSLSIQEIIQLGDNYQKESDTAIAIYSISNKRYHENMSEEEKLMCVNSFLKTGDAYYKQGNYNSAFDHYIQGMKICESCHNKEILPDIYLKLGTVYCTFLDYEMGISYYEKAHSLYKKYPNNKREYSLFTNLSSAHSCLNHIPEAKRYYNLSKQLTQPNDTLKNYMNLLNWGLILINEKKYDNAIQIFRKSAQYAEKYGMEARYECSSYEELYKAYKFTGNIDSAFYYLKRCSELARKNEVYTYIQSLKAYSALYEAIGDSSKALYYKGKYLSLADSIFNVREFNRIKHTQSIYEMDKTNKQISYLNAEKKQKDAKIKTQRKWLGGILLIIIVISSLLWIVYNQKRKLSQAYKNLFNINLEILSSEHYCKTLRNQYEEKLYIANKALKMYQKEEQQSEIKEEEDTNNKIENENSSKYQTSNLADKQKQKISDAISQIMESTYEYCQEDFSLEKLATLVNSNSKYVSQTINETYHKNFNIYVNEYRIQEARARLANAEQYGNYTIKAIAESVGYKSTTTFTNAFKGITGITPSVFQKMAKENKRPTTLSDI